MINIKRLSKVEKWTREKYMDFIHDIQDNFLDEDDSLTQVARDLLSTNEGLQEYIENELGDSNPVNRLANDLS